NENNGLCTSTWGPPGWFFLHCVAAGYPVDPDEYDDIRGNARGHTRRGYSSFFKNTGHVLPCRFCRESYVHFLSETPVEEYLHSRQALFEWLFVLHNKVNDKIGDKQETDLESVVNKYERFRAKCHHHHQNKRATGCTEPAKHNDKMRCKLVVEPVTTTRDRWILWITVAGFLFFLCLFIYYTVN
ncbi:unnamed protein product, partial [Ectocarpus fasciculatus]